MATDAVRSNTTSVETSQRFRMACMTLLTHFLPEFFVNPRCPPTPTIVKVKAVEIDLGEAAKDPKEGVVVEEHG